MRRQLRREYQERVGRAKTVLDQKIRESVASVLPILGIVLVLSFTVAPVPTEVLLAFLMGAVLLIVGMALFNLGFADFRVRLFHGAARLQLPAAQMADAIVRRDEIRKALAPWFDTIMLDLKDR